MKAQDLMTENPGTCEATDTLRDAIDVMRDEDCGLIPITQGNGESRVVGVVTDRDIALYLGEEDRKPSEVLVEDVMTTDIVSCEPGADVADVSRKMARAQVRRILVVENGRLRGVIAMADLARLTSPGEAGRVIEKISEPGPAR
jgi:CBS domain-containing protein